VEDLFQIVYYFFDIICIVLSKTSSGGLFDIPDDSVGIVDFGLENDISVHLILIIMIDDLLLLGY